MVTNGGFLVTKIKQLGDRIFEKVLAEKGIDAFNGPQGRILYVLWQQDGVPIKTVSDTCGLAITSLTTMLERMERQGLIRRESDSRDKRKTLLFLTDKARALLRWARCTTRTSRRMKSGSSRLACSGYNGIWRRS